MRRFATRSPVAVSLLVLSAVFLVVTVPAVLASPAAYEDFAVRWLYDAVMIGAGVLAAARVRTDAPAGERRAWWLIGAGIVVWAIGDVIWTFGYVDEPNPPYPSVADAFWLAIYPPLYAGLLMLVRSHSGIVRRSLWLDGVIGGLAVASVGMALVLQHVVDLTGGSRTATAANLMYPLADLTLIGLVVWILAASGWHPGRAWSLLLGGLVVFAVSDCLYLFQTASGTYQDGGVTDLGWLAGGVLLAWAAWQPRGRERIGRDLDGLMVLLAPVGFGLMALAVQVYDHFERVDLLSIFLSTAALVGVCARLLLTFAENHRMLGRTRTEARTDPLTGLGNRRQLTDDLDQAMSDSAGGVLGVFDLNGFKAYNDLFGHPAGDALLVRLGSQLSERMHGRGTVYRMGGDEFCLLVTAPNAVAGEVAAAGAAALASKGDGFAITAAYGSVEFPDEASSSADVLRLADRRMYSQKNLSRGSACDQSMSVLLRAQRERDPRLAEHLRGVAELAEAVANAVGLPEAQVREARLGAMLHDVGKMAIPDAILQKRGPLTDAEWRFLRSHTVIGERILEGAPALAAVAPIVRSSHERYDGKGYPDGFVGDEIPIASRIVFVCDAFDAMIAERAYAPAMPVDEALRELWRCSGTKFDPRIVAAFCAVIGARRREMPVALAS